MSYWNYRVVEKDVTNKVKRSEMDYENVYYELHEVYYDDDHNVTFWSDTSTCPFGDLEDLKADLEYMLEACSKPILKESDLPDSGDYFSSLLKENGL